MINKLLIYVWGLLLIASTAYSQSHDVTGKVTSLEEGTALPGVNIIVKGTTLGTTTDADGVYKLSIPDGPVTLVFSFVGLETSEAEVGERTVVDISLAADLKSLTEIVVVGYGTQLKQDLTGNVAKVKGSDIQNVPVTSIEQALQGRAAGVNVSAQNGKLGQGMSVRIRGGSSISASNEPLYVVDGLIINNSNLSSTRATTNPLADINFNDIESIDILKDASAAAIYGARAANGVVIITTKRGKDGKTNFNFNMQYGSSKPTNHRKFLNSDQYVELLSESAANVDDVEFLEGVFDDVQGGKDWRDPSKRANTDWEKEAYQKAGLQSYDLTASGGNEKTKFYIGGGILNQDGILIGNKFQRYSGRINLDHQATKRLSFGSNVTISKTINNRVADDKQFYSPMQLVAQAPISQVRDSLGNLYDDDKNSGLLYYPATVERENSSFETSVFRNLVGLNAKYKIGNNLTVFGEYGFDLVTQNESRFQNSLTEDGRAVNGRGSEDWVRAFNQTYRAYLNWNKLIGKHSLDITAGSDFQRRTSKIAHEEAQGYALNSPQTLQSASTPTQSVGSSNEYTFLSYYARANYKFNQRYLLTLSARTDGSSKFGKNKRFGFFPAASAGWIISQESFLIESSNISFLKLRASYGLTGNADIPNYQYLSTFQPVNYDNTPGLSRGRLNNSNLGWENTTQFDAGIDFGFFADRLTGELDYYNKQTSKLLLDKQVPSTLGVRTKYSNIGDMENKGVELVMNYAIIKNSNLNWNIGFNVAKNKNKILKLDDNQEIIDSGDPRFLNVVKVGESLGAFYGPEYAGVDPANGDALYYINEEGDMRATTNDYNLANKVILGNPTPSTIYGFTMNASYKGFDLSILFQGVNGNKIYNAAGEFMSANGRFEDNQTIDQLRRWRNPGDITDVPQARYGGGNGYLSSSRYLTDGSYLRFKTLTIGYSLPSSLISKVALTSVRFYVTGQNLITFTKYEGWDPEVNTDYNGNNANANFLIGNDFYSAPQAKSYVVGLKVGF